MNLKTFKFNNSVLGKQRLELLIKKVNIFFYGKSNYFIINQSIDFNVNGKIY